LALPVISLQFDFHGSSELCGSSEMAGRSWRPPCFAAASIPKKTAAGSNRAAERRSPKAEARVTFHRAYVRHALIKAGRCRCALRLWNPEIALTTLTSSHAVCHAARAGGSHSSSTFSAAPPATSNQHG
jgi:hypothetical protein